MGKRIGKDSLLRHDRDLERTSNSKSFGEKMETDINEIIDFINWATHENAKDILNQLRKTRGEKDDVSRNP